MQHQPLNASSESLPPPPAYLLDKNHQPQHLISTANSHYMTSSTSMGQMSSSNVKTINDLRQSPGVMRRQLSLISNHHPPSNHSQNSHVITFLSFLAFPLPRFSYFSSYQRTTKPFVFNFCRISIIIRTELLELSNFPRRKEKKFFPHKTDFRFL